MGVAGDFIRSPKRTGAESFVSPSVLNNDAAAGVDGADGAGGIGLAVGGVEGLGDAVGEVTGEVTLDAGVCNGVAGGVSAGLPATFPGFSADAALFSAGGVRLNNRPGSRPPDFSFSAAGFAVSGCGLGDASAGLLPGKLIDGTAPLKREANDDFAAAG